MHFTFLRMQEAQIFKKIFPMKPVLKENKFLPPKYCKRFMPSTYLHGITGPVSLAPAETMRERRFRVLVVFPLPLLISSVNLLCSVKMLPAIGHASLMERGRLGE